MLMPIIRIRPWLERLKLAVNESTQIFFVEVNIADVHQEQLAQRDIFAVKIGNPQLFAAVVGTRFASSRPDLITAVPPVALESVSFGTR
jgi:hypothetical protein